MDLSFAEQCLILLDRIERGTEALREVLRSADEFLLAARDRGTGELPEVVVDNQHVQSLGVVVAYSPDHLLVRISSRADEKADKIIPPGQHEVWNAPVAEETGEEE